jgi:hypothetical protein
MAEKNNLEKNRDNLIKQKELYLYELALKLNIDLENYDENSIIDPLDPKYNFHVIIRKNLSILKNLI